RRRLHQILAAHEEYMAQVAAVWEESGYDAMEESAWVTLDEIYDLVNRLSRIRATTVAGLSAKKEIIEYCSHYLHERWSEDAQSKIRTSMELDVAALRGDWARKYI